MENLGIDPVTSRKLSSAPATRLELIPCNTFVKSVVTAFAKNFIEAQRSVQTGNVDYLRRDSPAV